jgi:magnesium-transporting ATPase (P-type)
MPFESERRFGATFNDSGGGTVAHVKGAVETVLGMCPGADRETVTRQANAMAETGFRVIALACGQVDTAAVSNSNSGSSLTGLRFLGLAGLIDPVRRDVPASIEKCHAAGVEVLMVTGDHPGTGLAIARQVGIAKDESEVVHGRELAELDSQPERLKERVRGARVFARVEPSQKMQLVTSLQEAGHFVAVTGDGVNDAPALRAANIGIAMGRAGTDVARGAADLILTDDNFTSIVDGIEEGRAAYDNVRKIIWLLLATAAGELVLFTLSTITGLPAPLTPVQLLWLNVVTEGIQGIALAFEKREPGVLERPPRPPSQQIFDRRMIEQIVLAGAIMGGASFGLFYWMREVWGDDDSFVRNHVLLLMVLFENVHVFNSRSETRSAFGMPFSANPLAVIGVFLAQGLHIGAMYTPGLSEVLEIEPVSIGAWASLLGISLSLLVAVDGYKRAKGMWAGGNGQRGVAETDSRPE